MSEATTPPAADSGTPAAAPPAVNAPVPAIPAPLAPGWRTSEAWLTLLTMILGAIPVSGLTANAPLLAKIVGMAIAAIAGLHYTAQRTALKRAHLAARSAVPTQISMVPQVAASAALVALVLGFGIVGGYGCKGVGGTIAPIAAGGSAFLQCGKQDLTQLVGDKTLLATVATNLLEDNYAQAVADLIGKIGSDAVGCAVLAVDTVAVASAGKTNGPRALKPQEIRAKELIAKYHWQIAPPAAPAPTPTLAAPASAPAPTPASTTPASPPAAK